MDTPDLYNFSIFKPRHFHGRKNRNVILTMLLIWAVAVFGFQFILRAIEKPVPEKALIEFESVWPGAIQGTLSANEYKSLLHSLIMVKGKNMVKPEDQHILTDAISCTLSGMLPDDLEPKVKDEIVRLNTLKSQLIKARDEEYLEIKSNISSINSILSDLTGSYTGFSRASLENAILNSSLQEKHAASLNDAAYKDLPQIMKLYLTHNRSALTDTKFLGFPFHYFYTAVFLLILFIGLCVIYNILTERRLDKEGVVE